MDTQQDPYNEMSIREIKLYFIGLAILIGLFVISIIFDHVTTPLMILRLRLSMLAGGSVYFLAIFIYYELVSSKSHEKLQETISDMIIIMINGKEIRR